MSTTSDCEFTNIPIKTDKGLLDLKDPYEIAEHLPALASGTILAIRICEWRSKAECRKDVDIYKALANGSYTQEPTLKKGGPTVYDYENREQESDSYFSEGQRWNQIHRNAFGARISAPDKLAAILAETHAVGLRPEPLSPRKVPSMQVARIFGPGAFAGIHVDRTDFDWPGNRCAASQEALFSALTYHSVADVGGGLVLYGNKLSRAQWLDARDASSAYALDASKLNPYPLEIQPEIGDLILFNAHCAHAVRLIVNGERVTSSNFFAWRGKTQPLGRFA